MAKKKTPAKKTKNSVKKKTAKKKTAKKVVKKTAKKAAKKTTSTAAAKPSKSAKKVTKKAQVAQKAAQKSVKKASKKKTKAKVAAKTAPKSKVKGSQGSASKASTKKTQSTEVKNVGKKGSSLADLAKKIVSQAKDKILSGSAKDASAKAKPEKPAKPPKASKSEDKQVAAPQKAGRADKRAKEEDFDAGEDIFDDDMDFGSDEEVGEALDQDATGPRVKEKDDHEEEVILTDAEGRRYCRVRDCDQVAVVEGYCRYHYLMFWKRIQVRKKILTEGKLARYIEDLTARYPDKYLEMLKKDLRSEKDFLVAIQELEIDESADDSDYEDEAQNYIEEVRGMSESSGRDDDDY